MANKTKNPINLTDRRIARARLYLAAQQAADVAAAAAAEAREAFLAACPDEGVLEIDGRKITISQQNRRAFDVDALAERVDPETFSAATKPTVDTHAFDILVLNGSISDEVVGEVVTVTVSPRVTLR